MLKLIPQFAVALACGAAVGGDVVELQPVESGFSKKMGGYRPLQIALSSEKPDSIKRLPDGFTGTAWGVLSFRSPAEGAARIYHIALSEPETGDAALLFDANGNGDLTDDPAVAWKENKRTQGGKSFIMHDGSLAVPLDAGEKSPTAGLNVYRFNSAHPSRQKSDVLFYYRDYGYEGELDLAGKHLKAALVDEGATGDFRGVADAPESGVFLLLDVNTNDKWDKRGERFDVRKPFNIGGTTYEIADMTPSGRRFKIVKSSAKVDEIAPPPDLSNGQPFPPFDAKDMDGKAVKFPADFKGKVVLVDFWATWCGPCMGEVPNLSKAYTDHKDHGFDVLGISLDRPDAADKIRATAEKNGMPWRQIYDGGFWKAELAQKYVISSIPAAFLVDGDTGLILASGRELRGNDLAPTIEKALKQKSAVK